MNDICVCVCVLIVQIRATRPCRAYQPKLFALAPPNMEDQYVCVFVCVCIH